MKTFWTIILVLTVVGLIALIATSKSPTSVDKDSIKFMHDVIIYSS